jgi:DNA polymerase III delta prime subunit
MSFLSRNAPITVADLVCSNQRTKDIIIDYANGNRSGNLMLHGPAGSGKSQAAKVIVRERLGDFADSAFCQPYHAHGLTEGDVAKIQTDWTWQQNQCGEAWTIIDEVDFATEKVKRSLREVMDNNRLGRFICTTNAALDSDDPFADRFHRVQVSRPSANDWLERATEIMRNEGHDLSRSDMETLLDGFEGSARELMRELETYHNKLNRP